MTGKISPWIVYALLVVAGGLVMLLCIYVQGIAPPPAGEYYYSETLRNNYTYLAPILLLGVGIAAGYFFKLNPWATGICLIMIFPLTATVEATVYLGSHNLIPFEMAVYFFWSLPAIAGAYLGRWWQSRSHRKKSS